MTYLADRFGLTVDQAEGLGVGYAVPGDRPQPWLSRGFTRHPGIAVPLYGFDGVGSVDSKAATSAASAPRAGCR
ncbi:hypothetical protein SMICM304S_03442 [Streptomyces microflavus]